MHTILSCDELVAVASADAETATIAATTATKTAFRRATIL